MENAGVTYTSSEHAGIKIEVCQYQPTDRPIEDRFSVTANEASSRLIIGVYDGHGGAATAEHISHILPAALLNNPPSEHARVFKSTDESMIANFTNDHSILRSKSRSWVEHAQIVKSGCTALILDVDVITKIASFANAGDCRVVVFSTSVDPNERLLQTKDLNAKTPSERERLKREHPGEDLLVVSGRLFGRLMSTRGFGDACYKLPNGPIGNWKHRKYIDALSSIEEPNKVAMNAQYQSLFYGYRTPPYLTATPMVGTMQLQENDVVIMATDGLWDCVSSKEVADIVRTGVSVAAPNLLEYLLDNIRATKMPGDDVTIVLFQT
ncbi:phosphatase 2C-like domain-containing protein [Collybia nuda]|uniref:Phosphatase 2C-like domain-containing protein n=1 Tax=Collybia nuda TaxID=64659 RepID=A0A9P5Y8K3_9AGAR|nr:phosphatase 2C-like domain-containing protein [Collybia nuda]